MEFDSHDDVIKWKHFPRYWPFVRGIHRSPVTSPHKDQWRGALAFSLICAWINVWVNNREAGDLRRHRAHYDVIGMNDEYSLPRKLIWNVCTMPTISLSTWTLYQPVYKIICAINNLPPGQMDAISQAAFSNAFSWMNTFVSRFKFHWSLLLRVKLTIKQYWFR